jgi:hypothetical protein
MKTIYTSKSLLPLNLNFIILLMLFHVQTLAHHARGIHGIMRFERNVKKRIECEEPNNFYQDYSLFHFKTTISRNFYWHDNYNNSYNDNNQSVDNSYTGWK